MLRPHWSLPSVPTHRGHTDAQIFPLRTVQSLASFLLSDLNSNSTPSERPSPPAGGDPLPPLPPVFSASLVPMSHRWSPCPDCVIYRCTFPLKWQLPQGRAGGCCLSLCMGHVSPLRAPLPPRQARHPLRSCGWHLPAFPHADALDSENTFLPLQTLQLRDSSVMIDAFLGSLRDRLVTMGHQEPGLLS